MTTLDKCCRAFIVTMGVGAAWIAASEPMVWAMPSARAGHASHQAQFHGPGHSVTIPIAEAGQHD